MEMLSVSALAYFSLAMTILSLWVKRSPWIWGAFLILAFALGSLAKIVEPIALAPIGGLLVLHTLIKGDVKGLARFVLVSVAIAVSIGLMLHYFPGFHNWKVAQNLWINFDKPFIGIFVLALGFPLLKNTREFGSMLKVAIPLALAGILLMAMLGIYSGLIQWDPKLPKLLWIFAPVNLIFVSIIEEAFWRGFVQNELQRAFGGKSGLSALAAILVTSLGFAAMHYFWAPNFPFLALVFVASVIYGSVYTFTKALEASILTHWLFNLTHFLLFTYSSSS